MMQEQSVADIKSKFKSRFRKQLAVAIILLPIILALIIGDRNGGTTILGMEAEIFGIFAIVLVIVALVFSLFNWRCPSCNKYLGREIYPKFCNKCGVQLRG